MVDYALKPSLARYEFREDREFIPAVKAAEDSDETLLALVQQQADIAGGYLRSGDPRKAIATLRRAYKLASDHGGADAEGSSVPAARRLALASIRLQLCAVLSRLGRHPQALAEARAAKHETDEVWSSALGGCGELVEASEEGIDSKPAAPLRRLLLRPPRWLQNVVEASVQARQCIAVELEFMISGTPSPSEASASTSTSRIFMREQDDPGLEGVAGDEAAQDPEEEMQAMHREAVMLARHLLPDDHHTRNAAERAMLQSELRKQEAMERSVRSSRSKSLNQSQSPQLSVQLSPMASAADVLLRSGRSRTVRPAALNASLGESTAHKLMSALDGHMGFLNKRTMDEQDAMDGPITHESLFAPPGDVFNRSYRRSPFVKIGKKVKQQEETESDPLISQGAHRARTDSVVSLSGGKVKGIGGQGGAREKDPFRAWKLEVMDVNKMTMKEIKSRSFEGIKEMQADIKRDNRRFRNLWLREMDEDLLYEDRTFYTPHGMRATEKAERKYEAWKTKAYKPSEHTVQKKESQKKLFAYYGVPMSHSEPDLKAWGRVLRESHARTPAEKERARKEEEARRRKEEEARRRREEEERAALQKAAGGIAEKVQETKRRDTRTGLA